MSFITVVFIAGLLNQIESVYQAFLLFCPHSVHRRIAMWLKKHCDWHVTVWFPKSADECPHVPSLHMSPWTRHLAPPAPHTHWHMIRRRVSFCRQVLCMYAWRMCICDTCDVSEPSQYVVAAVQIQPALELTVLNQYLVICTTNTPHKHPGSKNECLQEFIWSPLPGKLPSAHITFTVMMHVCLCVFISPS